MDGAAMVIVSLIVFAILVASYREYKKKDAAASATPDCPECCSGCKSITVTCDQYKSMMSDFYNRATWLTNGVWLYGYYNSPWKSGSQFHNPPNSLGHAKDLMLQLIVDIELLGNPVMGPNPQDDLLIVAKVIYDNCDYGPFTKGNIFVHPDDLKLATYPKTDEIQSLSSPPEFKSTQSLIDAGVFKMFGVDNPYSSIQLRTGDVVADGSLSDYTPGNSDWADGRYYSTGWQIISSKIIEFLQTEGNVSYNFLLGFTAPFGSPSYPPGPSFYYDSGRVANGLLQQLLKAK